MNVTQLVAKLQKLPQDIDVMVFSDQRGGYVDIDVGNEPSDLIVDLDDEGNPNGLVVDDCSNYSPAIGQSVKAVVITICD
jgi:hypothetical protein